MTDATKTALYRHFDASGALLYVGVSLSAVTRLAQHRSGSPWYDSIARVEVEQFDSRQLALEAERKAIASERPRHNIRLVPREASERKSPRCENARAASLHQFATFKLAYSLPEVAEYLKTSIPAMIRAIDDGQLQCFTIENRRGSGRKRLVSGWSLVDYVEMLEREQMPMRGQTHGSAKP